MAYFDTVWYLNSVGHAAVAARPQNAAVVAGQIVRQFTAPAVASERCFICIVAGTTANTTDATWTTSRGAKTTDGTATWQEVTGQASLNGDATNTPTWTVLKAAGSPSLGVIIKRNNGASYQICSTVGSLGAAEPAFSDTAGVTTTETAGTNVWTSLGPVANFTGGQAPHARLQAVFGSGWFNNNTIYVGANHAETQAVSVTYNPAGSTAGIIGKLISHNHSGPYPPTAVMAGASITITGANQLTFQPNSPFYVYGVTFKAGATGASGVSVVNGAAANQSWITLDNCSLHLTATTGSAQIQLGSSNNNSPGLITLNNCTAYFGAVGQRFSPTMVQIRWQNNGSTLFAAGSALPAGLWSAYSGGSPNCDIVMEGIDLSTFSGNLGVDAGIYYSGSLLIKDCKLHASATVTPPAMTGLTVQLVRSSSS